MKYQYCSTQFYIQGESVVRKESTLVKCESGVCASRRQTR